jgi:NADH-quinone oxidoreductase subunit M
MQRTLFGEVRVDADAEAVPAALHDVAPLVITILAVVALGVAPDLFFGMIQDAVNPIVALVGGGS